MRPLFLLAVLLPLAAVAQPRSDLLSETRPDALATPRPHVLVEDASIRLADLFDGAGARGMAALGAAPPPGRRLTIETAQLAAIARAHGLAWRPLTGTERVVVERPGRSLSREEIEDVLRAEFARSGLDAETELELPGFQPPSVPLSAFVQLSAEQAHFDPSTRRFSVTLVVMAEGMPTLRQRLAGRAIVTQTVVVATRRLALGETIAASDVRLARMRTERVRPGATTALAQAVGQQARRPLNAEQPVMGSDIGAPILIEKNSLVSLTLDSPGLSLMVQGRALEAAARGQTVPVMNLGSRTIVEGTAVAPGRVQVTSGTTPVLRADGVGTAQANALAQRAPR